MEEGKSCGKILWEILAGKSCGKWRRGKSQFKKGSDWWKFSIWNRVMGSQPIRIQLGKILWENVAGNCCGKILQEILAGKSCRKILWEILVGNSCGKILREILAGKSCGKWRRGKSQFKKGCDWWKFNIWNRVMGSQPIRSSLGKCCGKMLREIVVGKSCRKILWEILAEKSCRKFLQENLVGNGGGEKANLRKAVIGGNLAFGIGWWGANQSGSARENLAGKSRENSCGKILRENLAGGKILQKNLAGNLAGKSGKSCGKWGANQSCRKILRENLAGNCCRKILRENLAGNLVGKSCGKWRRGKSQFKKGSDWWKFSIWNRVMGSQPIRIQLGKILPENVAGNCCGKILQENLAGNSCRKIYWEMEEWKKPI